MIFKIFHDVQFLFRDQSVWYFSNLEKRLFPVCTLNWEQEQLNIAEVDSRGDS